MQLREPGLALISCEQIGAQARKLVPVLALPLPA